MQNLILGELDKLVVHYVGNKTNGDGVRFSNVLTQFENIEGYIKQLIATILNWTNCIVFTSFQN